MNELFYIGIDVGGTKIEGALCSLDSVTHKIKIHRSKKVETPTNESSFFDQLTNLIKDLMSESKNQDYEIQGIGFGLPGSLHPLSKIMLNGNTQFLIGIDIKSKIQNLIVTMFSKKIPLFFENDANCFILAEAWAGVGFDYQEKHHIPFKEQVAIGITLGTGVGGGLVASGKILSGALGAGMEVGHISLNSEGPQCYCGQRGCAETYLSGTALNKLMDSRELFNKAEQGDNIAQQILFDYRKNFSSFLALLINLLNPHYIVFGGGLSEQKLLFSNLKQDLTGKLFLGKDFFPEILISKLPLNAGVYGAIINAHNNLQVS